MNYLDLYSSYPDRTITSAWDAQLKYGSKNPWLNEALEDMATSYSRASPRVMRNSAPCLAARGADFSGASHALRISAQPCRNAYNKVDNDYSTRWLGPLPVLPY